MEWYDLILTCEHTMQYCQHDLTEAPRAKKQKTSHQGSLQLDSSAC